MERIPVKLPDHMWDKDAQGEGAIINWFVEDGDTVEQGQTIAEIMVEKVTMEVNAPASGKIHILKPVDSAVVPGDVIAEIEPL